MNSETQNQKSLQTKITRAGRTNVVFAQVNVLQRRVEFERVRELPNRRALLLPLGGLGLAHCSNVRTHEVNA